MQNGDSSHQTDNHDDATANDAPGINDASAPQPSNGTAVNGAHDEASIAHETADPATSDGTTPATANKKRKFAELAFGRSRSTSRAASPPWKAFAAQGPTQFTEGGKRRSGRVNAVPLDLQPPSNKRQTRAQIESAKQTQDGHKGSQAQPMKNTEPARVSSRREARPSSVYNTTTNGTAASLSKKQSEKKEEAPRETRTRGVKREEEASPVDARNAAPEFKSPERKRSSRLTRKLSPHSPEQPARTKGRRESATEGVHPSPKLFLRIRAPTIFPRHPGEIPKPSSFASLDDVLEHYDRAEKEQTSKDLDSGLEQRNVEKSRQTPEETAWKEARIRLSILEAAKPGGALSEERSSLYLPDEQPQPPPQYSHNDHLWAHGRYFKILLDREQRRHKEEAKKIAYACLAAWKEKQPQTEEEKEQEENEWFRLIYRQTVKDMQRKWELVTAEIDKRRLAAWQEQDNIERERKMKEMLEKSTSMLDKRRARLDSEFSAEDGDVDMSVLDEDRSAGSASSAEESGSDEDSEDDDIMSSSESEDSEAGEAEGDPDAGLTQEELRAKYASIPDLPTEPTSEAEEEEKEEEKEEEADEEQAEAAEEGDEEVAEDTGMDVSAVKLEEVDDALLDDSDESTDMSDDMGSSDEEDDDEEGSGSEEEADDEDDVGLAGFLSKLERRVVQDQDQDRDQDQDQEDTPMAEANDVDAPDLAEAKEDVARLGQLAEEAAEANGQDAMDIEQPTRSSADRQLLSADSHGEDQSSQLSLKDDTTAVPTEAESTTSIDPEDTSRTADSAAATPQPLKQIYTKVPSLLRGTLREYQHYGLDWLAKLYKNQTNGILADEMGLGKTIQTIALLAHLAEEHGIWGPHFIVVPTSVILNWEMEFKKFLPGFKVLSYYGTAEERAVKRKGWSNPDNWNVVITSYQLVLKDLPSIRVPEWHYMILDEAHNIKNFNSQRYQAMIRLKTHARLLLTGTPLQNSIQELWSLLTFLTAGQDGQGMGSLDEFTEWFRRPVEEIFVDGRSKLGLEAQDIVNKLHHSLRPYLLRRLKSHVEQQLPGKYEHTVMCRLSKRQRQLYDAFMSRSDTKANLASGNMISVSQALMALRKVCNHPDLFEERPINTSFVMFNPDVVRPRFAMGPAKAAVADFEITELLLRRRLMKERDAIPDLDVLHLDFASRERHNTYHVKRSRQLRANKRLERTIWQQEQQLAGFKHLDASSLDGVFAQQERLAIEDNLDKLRKCCHLTDERTRFEPIYGKGLVELCTVYSNRAQRPEPRNKTLLPKWHGQTSGLIANMVKSVDQRSVEMKTTIQKFGCITPNAVCLDMVPYMMPTSAIEPIRDQFLSDEPDAFHEARVRLSIAFPDKRLLQYDCGKLQRLATLLRELQSRGSRALIFTQMTQVLDILERFLNIHGYRYLRLDGSTKIEARQDMMERFNRDTRIDVFILSSRSGGVGMNLTGADTVIFYDLDWNPQMDKQCQDRAHRIGQTRDVHIYKFVSEHTIEVNILRKSNQKRLLDEVVIQEGEFTTDYFNRVQDIEAEDEVDEDDVAGAAIDRVFGSNKDVTKVLEAVEDREDAEAARAAQKEAHADDFDFDKADTGRGRSTPRTSVPPTPVEAPGPSSLSKDGVELSTTLEAANSGLVEPVQDVHRDPDERSHVDEYMLRFIEDQLKDVPFVPPPDKSKRGRLDKNGRDRSHRPKRPR
ncbi:swr1 complex component [Zalaria obscura]|uniref:Swr1 complex component n=1 Tax=Zalaria obscura TaxID=2024903 RepID=A0ACC3SGW9_9PEZI